MALLRISCTLLYSLNNLHQEELDLESVQCKPCKSTSEFVIEEFYHTTAVT